MKCLINKLKRLISVIRKPGKGSSSTYIKYPKGYHFNGKRILNAGCGNTTYPATNVVNLDYIFVPGVNVVCNLGKEPIPFKDGEFDHVIANHILEHIPNWFEAFKEMARVVKVGGMVEVWGPGIGDSQLGYRDHINIINHCSFYGIRGTMRNEANAWEEKERDNLGFVRDLEMISFQKILYRYWWIEMWPNSIQSWISDHMVNVVSEIGFKFIKLPPYRKGEEDAIRILRVS